jgi:hemerythrin superfamily protein
MERDKNLQPLSHQHHDALMCCLLLKKGVQKNTDPDLLNDFLFTQWKNDISSHLEQEEKYIFPLLPGSAFQQQVIRMIKTDHELLRTLIGRMQHAKQEQKFYRLFAMLLEQHIRFEERTWFGFLQENLSPDELSRLGNSLREKSSRSCKDYAIKFWE